MLKRLLTLIAILALPLQAFALSIPFQTDKTAFTEGSGGVQVQGGCFNATRGGSVTEDYVACMRINPNGDQQVIPVDASGAAVTNSTANAIKVLAVDSTGATITASTIANEGATIATGATNVLEALNFLYAYNSDSGATNWSRFSHQPLNFDSGAGTENLSVIGIALPASGGPVIGGTASNPFRMAPDGTTWGMTSTSANVNVTNSTLSVTQSGSWSLAANQSVNVAQINGVAPSMGNGVSGTGVQRVTLASDSTGVLGATQSGTWTVQPGNTANTTPWLVSLQPATSGGLSPCYLSSAATTNATNCKASAGQLSGYRLYNTTTSVYYLRLYNLATAPTCSSATGFVETIPVPPAASAGQVGGTVSITDVGEAFETGIAFCLTGGGGSTDNTSAASGVHITLLYK